MEHERVSELEDKFSREELLVQGVEHLLGSRCVPPDDIPPQSIFIFNKIKPPRSRFKFIRPLTQEGAEFLTALRPGSSFLIGHMSFWRKAFNTISICQWLPKLFLYSDFFFEPIKPSIHVTSLFGYLPGISSLTYKEKNLGQPAEVCPFQNSRFPSMVYSSTCYFTSETWESSSTLFYFTFNPPSNVIDFFASWM